MNEAALLTLDLLLMAYCCWVVVRASRKDRSDEPDLGIFAYKVSQEKERR